MARWLNKQRIKGSCSVLAILNAAKWQVGGYNNQSRSHIHEWLCQALNVYRGGGGPSVSRVWEVIRHLNTLGPRVYSPTFRKLNAILKDGSAAIVIGKVPGHKCLHAVFVYSRCRHPRRKGVGYCVVGLYGKPKWINAVKFRHLMQRDLAIFTVYGDAFEKSAA